MSTVLGKNESKMREDSFIANLILFWLKANYTLTSKRVTGDTPNTLFGLIPLGKKEFSQPLKTVASVASSTQLHLKVLIVGLILVGVGFTMMDSIVGIVLLVIGAINLLNSYTAVFLITNNAGQSEGYSISILEKSKVESFVNEVNTVISDL
jgi:hypothetical protein